MLLHLSCSNVIITIALNSLHVCTVCANNIIGDPLPDPTRVDFQTTFPTDDAFLLVTLGVVNCYGHIEVRLSQIMNHKT